MSRPRGGYIGFNRVPAASVINSAASGVWTLREAEAAKRAGTWPITFENPASISGLQLWLDAADSSKLFDATTGGSAVAADGGVARWEDKSGNGRHFTQSTIANRPARRSSGRNGFGTLEFDGSNDRLVGDATVYFNPNVPYTAIIVHVVSETAATYPILFSAKTTGGRNNRFFNSTDGNYQDYAQGTDGSEFARTRFTSVSRGTWGAVGFNFTGSSALTAASFSARFNGAGLTRLDAAAYTANLGNASIGSDADIANHFKGHIAEILIYSKSFTNEEMLVLEEYLRSKWALY